MDLRYDPNLVLYLPFYELDGASFMSRDKHGHLATVTGALWTPRGRTFDGVDDLIAVGTVADFSFIQNTGIFTICGWVKLTDYTADRGQSLFANTVASAEKGFQFIYDNRSSVPATKQFRVDIAKGTAGTMVITSYSANNMLANNDFHFWAASGDATNVFFSVDGAPWEQGTNSITALSSGDSGRVANIGRSPYTTPYHWLVGTAGEVFGFTRKITNAELAQIWLATKWRYQ